MKKSWFIAAAFVAATATASSAAEVLNRVVASIDGEPITLYEFQQYAAREKSASLASPQTPSQRDILQALITEKLVAKEIAAQNIRVRDEDVDHYIDRIKAQNRMTDEQLKAALQQQGLSYDKYRNQVKTEIEKIQLLNRQIRGRVNVTPEDVQRYYDAHKEQYRTSAKVHLRHIMLRLGQDAPAEVAKAVTDRAEALRKRIVEGKEDFAKIAKESSEDGAAADGGDLGEVEPSQVLPEFEAALKDMKEGEVSQPIRTRAGVHILKLEKRMAPGYRPVADLAEEIKDKLYNQALDERYRRWLLEDLQKHHYVEVKL